MNYFIIIGTVITIGLLIKILHNQKTIIMEQVEAVVKLQEHVATLTKANTELQNKIKALEEAKDAADDVSPELATAIDNVIAAGKGIDDIVPDVV